jgi:hypothetical protein
LREHLRVEKVVQTLRLPPPFLERVGEPRIPEFFSRSVVSLVTAKGEPIDVE